MRIELLVEELQGQFLKSCGAIPPATPIGIRKASKKQDTPQRGKHFGSSQSHSSNSDAVFHWDELCEEVGRSSLVTSEQTTGRSSATCFTLLYKIPLFKPSFLIL